MTEKSVEEPPKSGSPVSYYSMRPLEKTELFLRRLILLYTQGDIGTSDSHVRLSNNPLAVKFLERRAEEVARLLVKGDKDGYARLVKDFQAFKEFNVTISLYAIWGDLERIYAGLVKVCRRETDLETFLEFSSTYAKNFVHLQKDPQVTNVLYPGSGWDMSSFIFAFDLLHSGKTDRINIVFTELGSSDFPNMAWPEDLKDLDSRIKEQINLLECLGLIRNVKFESSDANPWQSNPSSNSRTLNYSFEIIVDGKPKKMTLTVGYNTYENRPEISENEKKSFSRVLIENARNGYWPKKLEDGKIYPAYFLQKQFDACDVLISKMSGDVSLLMFDIVRGFWNTKSNTSKVVLTDESVPSAISDSLPKDYTITMDQLKNNSYGYCHVFPDSCVVKIFKFAPKGSFTKK